MMNDELKNKLFVIHHSSLIIHHFLYACAGCGGKAGSAGAGAVVAPTGSASARNVSTQPTSDNKNASKRRTPNNNSSDHSPFVPMRVNNRKYGMTPKMIMPTA